MLEKLELITKESKKIEELPFTMYDGMVVYDYYDQPLNFSFLDDNGNLYIGNFFEWDKQKNKEYWICVPVTPSELNAYEKDEIKISSLFHSKLSEGVYIYVNKNTDNSKADVYITADIKR